MNARHTTIALMAAMACGPSVGIAVPLLGDAQSFAVLGNTGVTNPATDSTSVIGNLGVITPSVSGFPAGTVSSGTIHSNDGPGPGTAINAEAAIGIATGALNGLPGTTGLLLHPLATQDLGSLVGNANNLSPGVYTFTSSVVGLHGALILDAGGSTNPVFVFRMPFALTTDPLSSVVMTNGGRDAGIFWLVGSQATLDVDTAFEGNILAGTLIALNPGAQIVCGRAFAQTQVTFAGFNSTSARNNLVDSLGCEGTAGAGSPTESSGPSGGLAFTDTGELALIGTAPVATVPEPTTLALLGIALFGFAPHLRRRRTGRCSRAVTQPSFVCITADA